MDKNILETEKELSKYSDEFKAQNIINDSVYTFKVRE